MPHLHDKDARRTRGDKLQAMVGERGEHPDDRAAAMAGSKASASAQGDANSAPEEVWTAAPTRQVSNYGNVRGGK